MNLTRRGCAVDPAVGDSTQRTRQTIRWRHLSMSIVDASLRKTWNSLRARMQVENDFLDEVAEQIDAWRQAGAR